MKIGFPLQKQNETKLANGFHGNEWLGLFDLTTSSVEQLSISDLEQKYGNNDLVTILTDLGVKVVICNQIQPIALKIFNNNNITVYKSESELTETNIDLLKEGRLKLYLPHMSERISCSSSCSSCSSDTCSES